MKKQYNLADQFGKRLLEWRNVLRFHFWPELKAGRNPLKLVRDYGSRGMTFWTDVKDWLGGWPMDFAGLTETQAFCETQLGLTLVNVRTGEGCTEYVFARPSANAHWRSYRRRQVTDPAARAFPSSGWLLLYRRSSYA